MTLIHEIPGKLRVLWNQDCHAIIDIWENYYIRIEEFHEAVLVKGLEYSKSHGGIAWIVDSSEAEGKFGKNILNYIETTTFPEFVKHGVKFFITIKPKHSSVAAFNVTSYSLKTQAAGLKLVEMESLEQAIDWLKKQDLSS
ncbi:MAG: hypothetical protein U9Q77_09415 [Candidatus Marinimicrobia bacterium]|nr:hypothetical protein [Candidatus Neomarinimicrobiota bacterium]